MAYTVAQGVLPPQVLIDSNLGYVPPRAHTALCPEPKPHWGKDEPAHDARADLGHRMVAEPDARKSDRAREGNDDGWRPRAYVCLCERERVVEGQARARQADV